MCPTGRPKEFAAVVKIRLTHRQLLAFRRMQVFTGKTRTALLREAIDGFLEAEDEKKARS